MKIKTIIFMKPVPQFYMNGYNQALKDIKHSEMIKMIKLLVYRLEENNLGDLNAVNRAKELIKNK